MSKQVKNKPTSKSTKEGQCIDITEMKETLKDIKYQNNERLIFEIKYFLIAITILISMNILIHKTVKTSIKLEFQQLQHQTLCLNISLLLPQSIHEMVLLLPSRRATNLQLLPNNLLRSNIRCAIQHRLHFNRFTI